MTEFVCGFMCNVTGPNRYVLLIKKTHPEWQAGKFNGVGGHVRADERWNEAMVREFSEETGLHTDLNDWNNFLRLSDAATWRVNFYVAFATRERLYEAKQQTDEKPEVHLLQTIATAHEQFVPNLQWIVPMAFQAEHFAELVRVWERPWQTAEKP